MLATSMRLRVALLTVFRATRIAGTLAPIYLRYLLVWLWYRSTGRLNPDKLSTLHRRSARKFYRLAMRMRGGLIKVGQIISTRVDVVPKEWAEELSGLQDKVDPSPWTIMSKRLQEELGSKLTTHFESISSEAIAAASFGQVHKAVTKDGRVVALKIQYTDIHMQLTCDLGVVRAAVPLFNIFVPKIPLVHIYREVRTALENELDYRKEAEFTRVIRSQMQGVAGVSIPEVIDGLTTEFVIATSFFEGWKITDHVRNDEHKIDRLELIRLLTRAYARMFFVSGVFQSDPHPGNLLVRKTGDNVELCILDFGQVKVLPKGFQQKLILAAVSFMGRDVDNFAKAVVGMGVLNERDIEIARPVLKHFFEEMFEMTPEDLKKLDVEVVRRKITDLLRQIEGIHIPTDLVLYGRAFSMLAGVCAALDPNVNAIQLARPAIMEALMSEEARKAMAMAS